MELNLERPRRKYESVVVLHPDTTEEQQKQFFQKNKEILSSFEGEFVSVDTWGKRKLANPVEKIKMGIYFHSYFEAKAEAIKELERTMLINDKVLRFMHVRLDDRKDINKHIEQFRDVIKASSEREQEREAKAQARKSANKRPRS